MTTKWIFGNITEGFPILNLNLHLFTVHNMGTGIMILGNILFLERLNYTCRINCINYDIAM